MRVVNIQYSRCRTQNGLEQILALQQQNLRSQITDLERKAEGFLTVSHELVQLAKMNQICPHILARSNEKVVGYALCMHPMFASDIPVLRPMFRKIEAVLEKGSNFMVMGQICIDKSFRSKGLFRGLYTFMKAKLQKEYKVIITEVDAENERSLQAHYAIGFEDLMVYSSAGQKWHLIQWEI